MPWSVPPGWTSPRHDGDVPLQRGGSVAPEREAERLAVVQTPVSHLAQAVHSVPIQPEFRMPLAEIREEAFVGLRLPSLQADERLAQHVQDIVAETEESSLVSAMDGAFPS